MTDYNKNYPAYMNSENYPKEEYDLARTFAKELVHEFGNFIKVVAVFGSTVKKTREENSDIDVLVVVDDIILKMDEEIVNGYRLITNKLAHKISPKLHITTLKLTSFWEYGRAGDPVVVNILKDGSAIIDQGFFQPMQALLKQGRIKPTQEAVWNYLDRVPKTLHNAEWHVMQAITDLYWAVIDLAHAVLMNMGEVPPSPEFVAEIFEKKLVKTNLLPKKYANTIREFYKIQKMIVHREVKNIKGSEYDYYRKEALEFETEVKKLLKY